MKNHEPRITSHESRTAAGVELRNLTKEFTDPAGKKVLAVNNVSFTVAPGELITLLGPSGCGKTTILRMIGGFELQTRGEILIAGRSMGLLPPNKRNTSMVFQSYALFPHLTVFNNIAYGLRVKKTPRAEIDRRVREIVAVTGLAGMENRGPGQLSGGQQQRVALARALVNEPAVLLFDEPLSNLDAKLRVSMRQEIRRIQRKLGITSVYVTHDQEEAVCISDRIVVINEGRVEQIAAPADLYERPASRFVAGFFGKVNFVPGEVTRADGDSLRVRLWDREFACAQPGHSFRPGQKVDAVLRPEWLELAPPAATGAATLNGTVTAATYLGGAVEYELEAGGVNVLLTVPNPALHGVREEGEQLSFRISQETLHLLPA